MNLKRQAFVFASVICFGVFRFTEGQVGGSNQSTAYSAHTEDCYKTKGCLFKPSNCTPFADCGYFVSYAPTPTNDWITFELATILLNPSIEHYVAVGFSDDRIMGDDAVTYCYYQYQNQNPVVGLAYNTPAKQPVFINDTNPANPTVKMLKVGVYNATLYCQFQQAVQPNAKNASQIRNLNVPYYILSASGHVNYPLEFTPHYFDSTNLKFPLRSDVKILLTNTSFSGSSSNQATNNPSPVNNPATTPRNYATGKCCASFLVYFVLMTMVLLLHQPCRN